MGRKEHGRQAIDDSGERVARGQFAHFAVMADVVGRLARYAQRFDDGTEVPELRHGNIIQDGGKHQR
jgi:hypothetical protein